MTDLPEELAGRSPEEVLAFLREADDEAIRDAVHGIGTDVVLDLLFTGMAGRFGARPGRSADRLAFALDDDGAEHVHVLELDAEGARTVPPGPRVRATLRRRWCASCGSRRGRRTRRRPSCSAACG